jgi:hypothetical protein
VNGIGGFTKKAPRKVAIPSLGPPPERKLIRDEMPPVFLQQNTPVQIWKSEESTVPARSKCEVLGMEPHRPPHHHVHDLDRGARGDLEFAPAMKRPPTDAASTRSGFRSSPRTTPLDAFIDFIVHKLDVGVIRDIAVASRVRGHRHPAIRPLHFRADGCAALITQ